ncbi:trypsin-like peptidase domain-containing protein [Streptosporangium sp. NPDC051023]|uniref:S1C family serine protease n=1 Tax=Streptosporangium sp. NPDC051023 TaxID=3155410 RepID=UPI00344F2194
MTTLEADYRRGIARVLPSVVQIITKAGSKELGEGSGIVYDTSGHIVTNAHVVAGATGFEVSLATGGASRAARVVGTYEPSDLAVLEVADPTGLVPADFGDSDQLSIGQIVLAMGNPLGLSGSVSDGIVSGLGRTVPFQAENAASTGTTINGLIQTTAAINPGNSGGALVDLAGEVVGVLVANVVNAETGSTLPGIGFAIPSNTVTDVARQIIKNGKVTKTDRATLGVTTQTVVSRRGEPAGVGVVRVAEGDGTARAALKPGSVIVSIDGVPTPTVQDLARALGRFEPGDLARVRLRRPDGSTATTIVRLGKHSGD